MTMKLSTRATRSWAAMIANATTTMRAVMPATRLAKKPSRRPRSAVAFKILLASARPWSKTPVGLRSVMPDAVAPAWEKLWMTAGIQVPPFSSSA
jgi:hypothetical protein